MRTSVERALTLNNFTQAVAFAPTGGEVKILLERLLEELIRSHAEIDALQSVPRTPRTFTTYSAYEDPL